MVLTSRKRRLVVAAICASRMVNLNRQYWVHPINKLRNKLGDHLKLDIKHQKYPEKFKKETRFTQQFDELLLMTEQALQKRAPRGDCIAPRIRLYVTLKYLAHGTSMAQLADSFCLRHSTVSEIINETTRVIWEALQPTFMPVPKKEDWLNIANRFEEKWNFPHCIGGLDGKHVLIQKPPKSGSEFYNYKNQFSTNLTAIADADYRFVMIDVGGYGKSNDSRVFRDSPYGRLILDGRLDIPEPSIMPQSTLPCPYFLVADDAFPMTTNILKPYPGRDLNRKKRIFNYRLSRARRVVENAFGILASRFRIFRRPIQGKVENIDFIVMAACVLHNFLRTWDIKSGGNYYYDESMLEHEDVSSNRVLRGAWRRRRSDALQKHKKIGSNNYPVSASMLRDGMADYFVHNYPVAWQDNYIQTALYSPAT